MERCTALPRVSLSRRSQMAAGSTVTTTQSSAWLLNTILAMVGCAVPSSQAHRSLRVLLRRLSHRTALALHYCWAAGDVCAGGASYRFSGRLAARAAYLRAWRSRSRRRRSWWEFWERSSARKPTGRSSLRPLALWHSHTTASSIWPLMQLTPSPPRYLPIRSDITKATWAAATYKGIFAMLAGGVANILGSARHS